MALQLHMPDPDVRSVVMKGIRFTSLVSVLVAENRTILFDLVTHGTHRQFFFLQPTRAELPSLQTLPAPRICDKIVKILTRAVRDKRTMYIVTSPKSKLQTAIPTPGVRHIQTGSIWIDTPWGFRSLLDIIADSFCTIPWFK